MEKVLLHICCGPCAVYPAEILKQEGFETEGFFYNPNIHPFSEYELRREAVVQMCALTGIGVIYHKYDFENFLSQISNISDRDRQHNLCWRIRLKETARIAKDMGVKNFTTTLLSSPYQNIEEIKKIGEDIALDFGLNFLSRDFRKGFLKSHKRSKEWQLYHQTYCGCVYSEKESIEARRKKKQ